MPYSSSTVAVEDHDVDRPPSLERPPLNLQEGGLHSDLTDDAITVDRDPNRDLVGFPTAVRVIDELPGPARRRLVRRTGPERILDKSCDRGPVGLSGPAHDDGYRDPLQPASVRFAAEAWIIPR